MIFQALHAAAGPVLAAAVALCPTAPARADLTYSCKELAAMAARFAKLKRGGYRLEDVLAVVQKASGNNPDKEALLSDLAIEIYVDAAITTQDGARALARERCHR
jgi:hypothetical protein